MSKDIARRDFEIYAKGVKRLEELEKETNLLNADKKFPAEVASIRSKLKHVSEIPQIEYEIKKLKERISGKNKHHVRHSSSNEKEIKKLKENIIRKSLQAKKFAPLSKEVRELKLEIEAMRKKIKIHEGEKKRKKDILNNIDVGVNKVFDNTFNLSLNEIKAKLSKEVENKKAEVQKELQADLVRREELFNEKYKQLEQEFHKKYNERVKAELEKEVKDRFDKLVKDAINRKNQISEKELSDLKRKLKNNFASKERYLKEHFEKDINEEKKMVREQFEEQLLAQKVKLHKKLDSELAKEVVRLKEKEGEKEHTLSEKMKSLSKLKEKLGEKMIKERESLESNEEKILNEKISEVEKEKDDYVRRLENEKKQFESEKTRENQKIINREEALKKKGEELKAELQKEFEEKLKQAIKIKQQELNNKNMSLEREIRKKVQMFYK